MERPTLSEAAIVKKLSKRLVEGLEKQQEEDPFATMVLEDKPIAIKQRKNPEGKRRRKEREETKKETDEPQKKRDNYTHFFSVPLHTKEFKQKASDVMKDILSKVDKKMHSSFRKQNLDQIHVTLSMLELQDEETREKVAAAFQAREQEINAIFENQPFNLTFEGIGAFWQRGRGKKRQPRVIFLELKNDQNFEKLNKLCHTLITEMLNIGVIQESSLKKMNIIQDRETKAYRPANFHVTLFRLKPNRNLEKIDFRDIMKDCEKLEFGTFPIKRIDVSTRFKYDLDKFYMPLSTMSLKAQAPAVEQIVVDINPEC